MSSEKKCLFFTLSTGKYIIFSLVAFLSLQNLSHSIFFKINFPYSVDFTDIFTPVFNFLIKDEFTLLINKGIHLLIFPKLIALPNLYFNSFDVVNTLYFLWIIASLTIFVMYLILKQTDKKLIWTIIPISAFIYSPLTNSGYFMLTMLEWYSAMLGITLIIYFLNKKTINLKIFSISIFFAIFSTFSILLGVASWIAGLSMLMKSASTKKFNNKKWLILWIISSGITGFCYLTLTSGLAEKTYLEPLFSTTGFSFLVNFVASSFRLKYDFLMIIVGSASFFLAILYTFYFIKKDYLRTYFPWLTFIFVGFCSAIITALGRSQFSDHLGNEPYYSTISQFFQIGLLVLNAKILSDFLNNPKTFRRKIIIILLILLVLSQIILLIPSYYSGWQRGQIYYDEKIETFSCYSLFVDQKCYEKLSQLALDDDGGNFLLMLNYLIQNKLSIFGENDFNSSYQLSYEVFTNLENTETFYDNGQITHANTIPIINQSEIEVNSELIHIEGWIDNNDSYDVLVLIDEEPFAFYNDFPIKSEFKDNPDKFKWSITMLSGYIPKGCNSIQVNLIENNEKFNLGNDIVLCKN